MENDFWEFVQHVEDDQNYLPMPRYFIRDQQNPLERYSNAELLQRYRFTRNTIQNMILPMVYSNEGINDRRGLPVPELLKLCAALRFYATGSYQHTLTGHSGKVMAAKFLGEASKVVTGSHDRTLKIWDLRSRACVETKFAGSSCNDLVTADGSGSTIISGHFDKRVRFWDTRSESGPNDIVLNGKVTSLDLTRDAKYLVACVRDDTLKLFDLRMNQVVLTFSCDGFKVGCDWTRATFSPDGQYISVGSADGNVFIWGVNTAKVETVLKEHTSAVTATAWHPYGSYLASVDRTKKAVIWSDI